MSELMKAADDVRKLLKGFKAFDDVANALEHVGGLQRAQSEAERALSGLGKEIEVAKDELAKIKSQAKKAAEDAKAKFENEATVAAGIAAKTIADAESKAASIIEDANKQKGVIQSEVERLRGEASEISIRRQAAQDELDKITANLEKVKAQAAKLLGA